MALQSGAIIDQGVVIGGVNPDLSSAIGYQETVGESCQNPNGYTQGSCFVNTVDGFLYEATTAIAYGATLTSGTNCSKTDVCTKLNELNADKANEIITDTVTASAESVSANTSKVFQIACTKAGYTPIGISTYTITGTYNDEVSVYRVDFVSDKSTVVVGCRNMHAGANSIGAKVVILYQKN